MVGETNVRTAMQQGKVFKASSKPTMLEAYREKEDQYCGSFLLLLLSGQYFRICSQSSTRVHRADKAF